MSSREQPETQGAQPPVEGAVCEELIAVQFWFAGILEEPVSVAHFKFNGAWHSLCFDTGIVFWRDCDGPPVASAAAEMQTEYRLHDVGRKHDLIGLRLSSIDSEVTPGGARVVLRFHCGRTVTFFDENDRSDYACESDAPTNTKSRRRRD